ncbi:acyltransferase [bacterium]|nr:acyltransferase [bacterium]
MLVNIQILRFFAALLVVFNHTAAHLRASGHDQGVLFALGESTGFGGVDIFFVISGFIMAWTTVATTGRADAIAFTKRRIARIYSGYWPFYLLALALFLAVGTRDLTNVQFLKSALLWPTELGRLLIPVSWTLIFEMYFYLMFALLLAYGGARRQPLLKLAALGVLGWSLYSHFGRHAYDPGQLETMSVYENYLAFPFLLEFLAGAILADWLRKRPQGPAWSMLVAGIVLWLLGGWINTTQFEGKLIQGYFVIWRVLILGLPAILLVAGLVRLENSGRVFLPRFSMLAGGASYAIYLSHTLILAATQAMGLNRWVAQFPAGIAQCVFLLLTVIIVVYSMAHYRWLERPLHRRFRQLLKS